VQTAENRARAVEYTPPFSPVPRPSMTFYRDRTVLITGASSGIGADMARLAGAAGARVILAARSLDALARVAADVERGGGTAHVVGADLQADGGAARLAEAVADETVDVLVNNAGFGVLAPFVDAPADDADAMVALNVAALTTLTRALLPPMVARQRGGVLNVASVAAFAPVPRFAVYAATKAYVVSFTEALSDELRGTGVHATVLCPGPVPTGFGARAGVGERFFSGGLPSEAVARAGLEALAAGRRRVVPGWSNCVQVAASQVAPTGVALRVARAIMGKA